MKQTTDDGLKLQCSQIPENGACLRESAIFRLKMIVLLFLAVVTVAGAASGADPALFESFDHGWQARWHYSQLKKYEGRFESVTRPSSRGRDTAIKVTCAAPAVGGSELRCHSGSKRCEPA